MPKTAPLTVGVVAEHAAGERRVALVPASVHRLAPRRLDVVIESGAGAGALIPSALYVAAGARISADAWRSDVVLQVAPPCAEETTRLRPGATFIAFLTPQEPERVRASPPASRHVVKVHP